MIMSTEVAGASLQGRKPKDLKVQELKRWLLCRKASTRGLKADLVARYVTYVSRCFVIINITDSFRVESYIRNGWDGCIVDPDAPSSAAAVTDTATQKPPADIQAIDTWKPIKTAFSTPEDVPKFSHGQMISYFVTRTLNDGLPAGDFKGINQKSMHLFQCGHIQHIDIKISESSLDIRCDCLPEMKKHTVYKVLINLKLPLYDISGAQCGCKAGMGPKASCKHIGALCYTFSEFCSSGRTQSFLTCTDQLQAWNKPRSRCLDILPVNELNSRRQQLLKKESSSMSSANYDPRPLAMRSLDYRLTENLRVHLANESGNSVFLQILVPPLSVLGRHGSVSLCRDERKNKMAATYNVLAFKR